MPEVIAQVTTDFLQAYADAWNRHDADALMSMMTEDDGTRVEVHGCDVFTLRDGRIALKDSCRKNRPPLGTPKKPVAR